jgi:hypothetical protein
MQQGLRVTKENEVDQIPQIENLWDKRTVQ